MADGFPPIPFLSTEGDPEARDTEGVRRRSGRRRAGDARTV